MVEELVRATRQGKSPPGRDRAPLDPALRVEGRRRRGARVSRRLVAVRDAAIEDRCAPGVPGGRSHAPAPCPRRRLVRGCETNVSTILVANRGGIAVRITRMRPTALPGTRGARARCSS